MDSNSDSLDRLVPLSETQRIAGGVHRITLWRWCREGRFPSPVVLSPQKRAWRESELRTWLIDPVAWGRSNGARGNVA